MVTRICKLYFASTIMYLCFLQRSQPLRRLALQFKWNAHQLCVVVDQEGDDLQTDDVTHAAGGSVDDRWTEHVAPEGGEDEVAVGVHGVELQQTVVADFVHEAQQKMQFAAVCWR